MAVLVLSRSEQGNMKKLLFIYLNSIYEVLRIKCFWEITEYDTTLLLQCNRESSINELDVTAVFFEYVQCTWRTINEYVYIHFGRYNASYSAEIPSQTPISYALLKLIVLLERCVSNIRGRSQYYLIYKSIPLGLFLRVRIKPLNMAYVLSSVYGGLWMSVVRSSWIANQHWISQECGCVHS